MASSEGIAALALMGAFLVFLWWLNRPVARGTRVNPVAGLRG